MLSHEKRGTNSDSDHVVMVINLQAMSNKIYPLLVVGWGEGRGGGGADQEEHTVSTWASILSKFVSFDNNQIPIGPTSSFNQYKQKDSVIPTQFLCIHRLSLSHVTCSAVALQ